jgi:pimeloyl-ACP methyl ester carboxylesterase
MRPPASLSLRERMSDDQDALAQDMSSVVLPDGSSIRVLDRGNGEPVVFVPMVTELNFVYAAQIAEFQTDHRVILYEPRLSTTSWVRLADRARELRSLLDALDVPSAHFVVWGDTGSAVYLLAREYPRLCRSVVFIGLADRYRFPQPYESLLTMLAHLPIERTVPSRVFATLLGRFVGGTQIRPEWIAEKAAQVPQLTALFKFSIIPNLRDHRPVAGEVQVPCLVIAGDNDRIVSAAQARGMAALLPCAGPAVIRPGGEHFVNYVDDQFVNETIRRFFRPLA